MNNFGIDNRNRLILVALNEINFDVVRRYLPLMPLPGFEKLLSGPCIQTSAEQNYETLEPWIQWPSAHCGLTAAEHNIFRLGDVVRSNAPQIFEQLESLGLRVGAVSAMNAANRLKNPAYFIPDPWTSTPPDNSWWSRSLSAAVSQAVNDNAKRNISMRTALHLALALLRFARMKHYGTYLSLALRSRRAPWRKALFLDLLLHDVHMSLFRGRHAQFSTLFLNAGAHIQHHYFFNARVLRNELGMRNPRWYIAEHLDPIAEMLKVYDKIVADYLRMSGVDIIVATGLSQRPYDRVKFYYRLRDHAAFLRQLGINFLKAHPRMTRDFLIEFSHPESAMAAEQRLRSVTVANVKLFGEIENRGNSLFVTLTYPLEVDAETCFEFEGKRIRLQPHVAFVAIKNGMHQTKGFAFFSRNVGRFAPHEGAHIKELYDTIMQYFRAFYPEAMAV